METSAGKASSSWRWVLFLAIAGGLAAAFGHTFSEMWIRWFPAWGHANLGLYDRIVGGESYYTHGPLVPLISLFITWMLLRQTRVPVQPAVWTGTLVLVLSLLLHLMACLARVNFVSGFAFIFALIGLVLLLWGWQALRRLWFPMAFLIVMVPLPEVTIATLNFELKMMASRLGVGIASFLGVLVERDGNRVLLQGDKILVIANVCNGLRTLISLLGFGALYAYVCRLTGVWRLGLFAMTIPVAVVSNAVRVVGLIVVADVWDVQTATGWFHDTSGILIYIIAFLLMFGLEKAILGLRKLMGKPAEIQALFHDVRRGPEDADQGQRLINAYASKAAVSAACVLAMVVAGSLYLNQAVPPTWNKTVARNCVPETLTVQGQSLFGYPRELDDNTLTILETRDYFYRQYVGGGTAPVDFCVIFSQDNRKGTHPPDLCMQGSGDGILSKGDLTIDGVEGRGPVQCRELIVQAGARRQYVLYTYKCGREYTSSFWRQQWAILTNGLLKRDSSGALIRVSLPIGEKVSDARQWAVLFLRAGIPHLDRSLKVKE